VRSGGYRWSAEDLTKQLHSVGFSDNEFTGGDGLGASLVIARRK